MLVTGGSGFIGSHVVDVLIRRGYEPRVFDLRESPHHEPGEVTTVLGDATDSAALAEAMEGCEAVIHLAAMADVGHVQKDPAGAERLNSRATAAVLEAARLTGVERVVYGSTIWVYSDCEPTNVDETTPLAHPAHLYSATKLAGELYCRSYAELYGVDYTILRFGIPYGPRARVAAVVPAMVERALNGEALTIAGDGSQGRRFVYVEDLAAGVVESLKPEAANRIYNLAGTETTTIGEIAYTVKDLLGDVEIIHTEARPGDFGGKEVSSERALAELGWRASTPFREGVRRYVAWRQEHAPVAGEPIKQSEAADAATRRAWRERLTLRTLVPSARGALSMAAVAASLGWGVMSDDSFGTFAKLFGGGPTTGVTTKQPEVGVLIDAPTAMASDVAKELRREGGTASIGLNGSVDAPTLAAIHAAGSDALPRLKPGGPVRWMGTRSQIKQLARSLGVTGHIYYEAPAHGFTYTQNLLAHTAGASALKGHVRVGSKAITDLDRGDIVELSVDGPDWRTRLHSLMRQLRQRQLRAVPADDLLRGTA
ncbi:MAG: UDP-glucose 4-epimerase [Thermoleophilaceae bacterium]|nr:UDP-glucose 4-epimerase [Thermoleophilaceae bacterium]